MLCWQYRGSDKVVADTQSTKKQHRARLKAWGVQKNIRNREMMHLARIKAYRDVTCKSTRFKLRGDNIDVARRGDVEALRQLAAQYDALLNEGAIFTHGRLHGIAIDVMYAWGFTSNPVCR